MKNAKKKQILNIIDTGLFRRFNQTINYRL